MVSEAEFSLAACSANHHDGHGPTSEQQAIASEQLCSARWSAAELSKMCVLQTATSFSWALKQ